MLWLCYKLIWIIKKYSLEAQFIALRPNMKLRFVTAIKGPIHEIEIRRTMVAIIPNLHKNLSRPLCDCTSVQVYTFGVFKIFFFLELYSLYSKLSTCSAEKVWCVPKIKRLKRKKQLVSVLLGNHQQVTPPKDSNATFCLDTTYVCFDFLSVLF